MADARFTWNHRLADGSEVLIRPIGPADAELDREFIENLSPMSRWFRFLSDVRQPSPELLRQLTDVDQVTQVALMAIVRENGRDVAIGVSRYAADVDRTSAELAIAVADAWQHKGVGTLLFDHLIEMARANGIRRLYSIDSAENFHVHDLAVRFGFAARHDPEDMTRMIYTRDLRVGTPAR